MEVSRLDISKDEKSELRRTFSKRLSSTLKRSFFENSAQDTPQTMKSPLVAAFDSQLSRIINQKSESEFGCITSGKRLS